MAAPVDYFGLQQQTDDVAKQIGDEIPTLGSLFAPKPGPKNTLNPAPTTPLSLNEMFTNQTMKDQADSGFFNQLASVVSVPQQLLYTAGKNLGEELMGREMTNKRFAEEMLDAVEGKSSMTFNDVLKSVDMDFIDFKVPGLEIKNPYARIPASILVGIAAGLAGGPGVGIAAGFGFEGAARGEGVVGSVADVFLDPLNKLRLFQATTKGAKAMQGAAKADSYLTQIMKGNRGIFDLRGELGLGKPIDAMFDAAIFPVTSVGNYIGENAGRILNTPGINWIEGAINPFTQKLNSVIIPHLDGLFKAGGAIAHEKYIPADKVDEIMVQLGHKDPELAAHIIKEGKSPGDQLRLLINEATSRRENVFGKEMELVEDVLRENFDDADLLKFQAANDNRKLGFVNEDLVQSTIADTPDELLARHMDTGTSLKTQLRMVDPEAQEVVLKNTEPNDLRTEYNTAQDALTQEYREIQRRLATQADASLPSSTRKFLNRDAASVTPEEYPSLVNAAKAASLPVEEGESAAAIISKLRGLTETAGLKKELDRVGTAKAALTKELTSKLDTSTTVANAEIYGMAKMSEAVYGKEALDNIHVYWSDAAAGIRQGTSAENKIAVQMMTNVQNGASNVPTSMSLNIYRAAGSDDAFRLMGADAFDNLYGKSRDFMRLLKKNYGNLEQQAMRAEFMDDFLAAGRYGKMAEDKKADGLFATILDGVRGFFRMMEDAIVGKQFRNKDVQKDILKFMGNGNYFDELRKVDAASGERLFDLTNVSKNVLAEQALKSVMTGRASTMQPKFLGMKPSVNGMAPYLLREHRLPAQEVYNSAKEFGMFNSATLKEGSAARKALYESPQHNNLLASIMRPENKQFIDQVLSEGEYDALAKLGTVKDGKFSYHGDVSSIARPGTPAWESVTKVLEIFDIKPLELYQMNQATLLTHYAKSIANNELDMAVNAIKKIAVGTDEKFVERTVAALTNSIDAAILDPELVNDIGKVVREFQTFDTRAPKLSKTAHSLLKKSEVSNQAGVGPGIAKQGSAYNLDINDSTTVADAGKKIKTQAQNIRQEINRLKKKGITKLSTTTIGPRLEQFGADIGLKSGSHPVAQLKTTTYRYLNLLEARIKKLDDAADSLKKDTKNKLPVYVTDDMVAVAKENNLLMGNKQLPVAGSTKTETFLNELRARSTDLTEGQGGSMMQRGMRLMAKQDLTFRELEQLQQELTRFAERLPDEGKLKLLTAMDKLPQNVADAAVSPTLTAKASAGRLFDSSAIDDKALAEMFDLELSEAGKVTKESLIQSPDVRQVIKEIEEKRGNTPQMVGSQQRTALTEELLGERTVPKEGLEVFEKAGWQKFRHTGTLPPLLEPLRDKLIPKSVHQWLQTQDINLGKGWTELGKTLNGVVKGMNDAEAAIAGNSTVDALEGSTLGKKMFKGELPEGARNTASRFFSAANYDYVTSLFKAQALLSPAYHMRNVVSGVVVNLMHGVGAGSHGDALKHMLRERRGWKTDPQISKWWDEFHARGGSGQGKGAEIQKDVAQFSADIQRPGISASPINHNFGAYRLNFAFGQYVDDMTRFASYIEARKAGKNATESIHQVKLLHFDYNDLSDFERKFMKRVIPFYTYMRKALARDSRLFMERTGNYYKMGHVLQQVELGVEDPEESTVVAEFVRERLGVPFHRNEKTGAVEYFMLANWIPAADFAGKFLKDGDVVSPSGALFEFIKENASSISPILKMPLEQALNHDFYFGKKISEYEGEESDFWNFAVNARMVKMLRSIRVVNDIDKLFRATVDRKARPDLPKEDLTSTLFNVFGGTKVVANLDPARNFERNVERPAQDLRRQLSRELRRGGSVNLENLQQQSAAADARVATEAQKAARFFGRVRKQGESESSPLSQLFARPNPENLPR